MFNKERSSLMEKFIIRKDFSLYKEPKYDHKAEAGI
ncbi:hypothetical protein C8J95_105104 [Elizabethkingia sp. YR214]|nr:hypothetical protein C8J95_105104 [Elizabethkingia sp. YR214]